MAYPQPNDYNDWPGQRSGYSSQPLTSHGGYEPMADNTGYHSRAVATVYGYQQTPIHGQADLTQPRSTTSGGQLWDPYTGTNSLGYTQLPGSTMSYGAPTTAMVPAVRSLHCQAPCNDYVEPYQQPEVYHAPNANNVESYHPLVMSVEGIDRHPFKNAPIPGPSHLPPVSRSSSNQSTHSTVPEAAQNGSEYSIPCPYQCGTVLHGVHAVGNLTRHLKSQTCRESPKEKVKYLCPWGCQKEYARSDGLRVHLRRRHGAPQAPPRAGPSGAEEDEEE